MKARVRTPHRPGLVLPGVIGCPPDTERIGRSLYSQLELRGLVPAEPPDWNRTDSVSRGQIEHPQWWHVPPWTLHWSKVVSVVQQALQRVPRPDGMFTADGHWLNINARAVLDPEWRDACLCAFDLGCSARIGDPDDPNPWETGGVRAFVTLARASGYPLNPGLFTTEPPVGSPPPDLADLQRAAREVGGLGVDAPHEVVSVCRHDPGERKRAP